MMKSIWWFLGNPYGAKGSDRLGFHYHRYVYAATAARQCEFARVLRPIVLKEVDVLNCRKILRASP